MKRIPKTKPTTNSDAGLQALVQNASLFRSELLKTLLDPRIDMDAECGYPVSITAAEYHLMYKREGIAKRVVRVYPKECWSTPPEVYEQEEPQDTDFETALADLVKRKSLWHFLQRADELSGVGRFGVVLLGLDDGMELNQPAAGLNAKGERDGNPDSALIYVRVFDESVVTVASTEQDKTNPRFGFPMFYNVNYTDESTGSVFSSQVHWSRIVHVADNREMSEVYGTPRMEPVYNRLMDVRKILSGSGEMFWRGAFPGYSFEVNPDQSDGVIDATAMREEFANYSMGMQRYLALTGVTAKSLAPQVADPAGHINAQMEQIAITLGIPKRILFGSERGELASSQDARAWNKRLKERQESYLTPMLVSPFVTRLVQLGVLPDTKEQDDQGDPVFTVEWPDLNTTTDQEKADVAAKKTDALAKYVGGNIETVMPLETYLTTIWDMDEDEASMIVDAAEEHAKEIEAELPTVGPNGQLIPLPNSPAAPGAKPNPFAKKQPPTEPAAEEPEGEEEEPEAPTSAPTKNEEAITALAEKVAALVTKDPVTVNVLPVPLAPITKKRMTVTKNEDGTMSIEEETTHAEAD